jgi:glutamate synthase (ferredoxin)
VSEAVGVVHPALITPDDVDLVDGLHSTTTVRDVYDYQPDWGVIAPGLRGQIESLMAPVVSGTQTQPT